MKFVLVGAGTCGALWRNAIAATGDFLVAVCDPDLHRAAELSADGARLFGDIDKLADDGTECDYVIVSTPVRAHPHISERLLEMGFNVIVEKPFSYTFEHYVFAKEKAAQCKKRLVCAYHAAHGAEIDRFLENRENIEDRLGALKSFECKFFDPYCGDKKDTSAFEGLYGSYLDSAVNALSVIARIIDLDTVSAVEDVSLFMRTDNMLSTTHYLGPVTGSIETNWTRGENLKVTTLFYEKGKVILHHSDQTLTVCGADAESVTDCNIKKAPRLLNQYVSIIEALRDSSLCDASEKILPLLLNGKTK